MYFLRNKKNYQRYIFLSLFFLLLGIFATIFLIKGEGALALSANYSKGNNDTLRISDWNELASDFLAKSGGVNGIMSGILNVSLGRITVVENPSEGTDAANKGYVDNSLSSLGGGSVFTNWGRSDCPAGTDELYEGFSFGSEYTDRGGGNNNVCLQAGGAGTSFTSTAHSLIQPLITVNWTPALPVDIAPGKFIRCAVCYKNSASCYIKTGDWSCDGSYSLVYEGYLAGAIKTAGSNYTTRDRNCINRNFDGTSIAGTTPLTSRVIVQGTKIDNNLGLTAYTTGHFTRCSVCCN